MPVVYSQVTGTKGFVPCSKPYRQIISRALQLGDFKTANELFQQGHRLVWNLNGNVYKHQFLPHATLSAEEYQNISNIKPEEMNISLLNQQCGIDPIKRPTTFIGPQLPVVRTAMKNMQHVQNLSYNEASKDGFPVYGFKGLATYAPSPFEQEFDAKQNYTPTVCELNNDCKHGGVCENGKCLLPRELRKCPPFQYPVSLLNGNESFTIHNPSAKRTVKTEKYSTFFNEWYDTCVPEKKYSGQQWITDPQLRKYIGLPFDVKQIPEKEWTLESKNKDIFNDPSTDAPYFMQDNNGIIMRVYKLNSAYTPILRNNNVQHIQQEPISNEPLNVAREIGSLTELLRSVISS